MVGLRQKKCTACGKLNPETAMRCACRAGLIDAPIIIVEASDSKRSADFGGTVSTGRWTCDACHFEQNEASDRVCRLCDQERAPPLGERAAEPGRLGTTYVLKLPFGEVTFTSDLAVGRDPTFCRFAEKLQTFERVSRKHAVLKADTELGLSLVDLGSTNGTYVNGLLIDRSVNAPLQIGDEVSFSKNLTGTIGRKP